MTNFNDADISRYIHNQTEIEKWYAVPIQIVEYVKSKSFILLIEKYLDMATPKEFIEDWKNYCTTLSPESIVNPLNYKNHFKHDKPPEEENNAQECLKRVLMNLTTRVYEFIAKAMGEPFIDVYLIEKNLCLSVLLNIMALAVISEPNRFEKKD